jgi:hypothetical protein
VAIAKEDVMDEELLNKLRDAMVPTIVVTLEPDEAERAGAFVEDAIGEEDALASSADLSSDDTEVVS